MIAPEGRNGGAPSKNGGGPEKEKDQAPSQAKEKSHEGPEVVLTIADRLDALERALGTVRRRQMTLQVHSLTRRDGALVLTLRAETGAVVPDRWIAELAALVDVSQIKVAGVPAASR